ncbi:MAG: Zn-dependent hydrolase [Acidimicrobiia bacterium]|nr:Zn-dependent hydrolase [Acidimicrobiia bacterium]
MTAAPRTCPHPDLRIDGRRLMARLDELAAVAPIDGGGVCRLALTDDDRAGRDLVVTWMGDLGLEVTVDGIGNIVGTRPGVVDGPPVMCGSHIDTVRTGGRYDGNLGVLAGLEVIETLAAADITTHHPLAVGVFTNEEGSRFAPDMMGSLVYVGGMAVETALDTVGIDDVVVGDALDAIGYRGTAPVPAPAPRAFVELHIEQGPVLEADGITVGAVTGVQGISWTEITVEGQSNHAGTTPMALRHDAGYVAADIATFVRRLALDLGPPMVGTVGAIDLHPDLVNVVAARALLTVDLRHTDDEVLQKAEAELAAHVAAVAEAEGVGVGTRSLARFEPVTFDPDVVDLVAATAERLGHTVERLPSGAGHDAQMLARVCPTAMIFTPSRDGISHNPAEHTDPAHLEAGANVLLQALLTLSAAP